MPEFISTMIFCTAVIVIGGGIIALLDWFSPNPPKWVVDYRMMKGKK